MKKDIKLNFPLIEFLKQGDTGELKKSIFLSMIVGVLTAVIIANVNLAAQAVKTQDPKILSFLIFAVLILLFTLAIQKASVSNVTNSQLMIHKFRIRVISEVFNTNLATLDSIGKVYILQVLGRDAQTISNSLQSLVTLLNSLATIVFISIYIAILSFSSFLTLLACIICICLIGNRYIKKCFNDMYDALRSETQIYQLFDDFLSGYKEIKMHAGRAKDISLDIVKESRRATDLKTVSMVNALGVFNYLTVLVYIILGLIVYVVPMIFDETPSNLTSIITASIFLLSSFVSIIGIIPVFGQANAAARALLDLEEALIDKRILNDRAEEVQNALSISTLRFENITYKHTNGSSQNTFLFGPFTYEFHAGKTYFISGKNGSGKTTLMRIISGLYQPTSGSIFVNSTLIAQPATFQYRASFATVFSDFFLFKKLYGLYSASNDHIDHLTSLMKMENKFQIESGVFSGLKFSSGQRKRIALIVALMENRPILLLDEWAADQDPEFRKFFYLELLPIFKSMGKTIIAITHDDKYFSSADHLLSLVNGILVEKK
jgi:putative ATP-binding cassette transporter